MKDNIKVVKFAGGHAQALSEIIIRNFFEINIKDYPLDEMKALAAKYTPEKIKEYAFVRKIFVAVSGGKPVGTLSVDMSGDDGIYMITMVFVSPEHHNMGIGRLLMKAGENYVKSIGGCKASLDASITAHEFYKKLGYKYKGSDTCPNEYGCYSMYKELD